jgi:hypothetical protein
MRRTAIALLVVLCVNSILLLLVSPSQFSRFGAIWVVFAVALAFRKQKLQHKALESYVFLNVQEKILSDARISTAEYKLAALDSRVLEIVDYVHISLKRKRMMAPQDRVDHLKILEKQTEASLEDVKSRQKAREYAASQALHTAEKLQHYERSWEKRGFENEAVVAIIGTIQWAYGDLVATYLRSSISLSL